MFCNFYIVKSHKIVKNSTTTKSREKNKRRFGILIIFLMQVLTKFINNQILHHKISHRFLLKTELYTGWNSLIIRLSPNIKLLTNKHSRLFHRIVSDEEKKFYNLNAKFRHASEITRETKGGYLEGNIVIPASVKFPVYLRLSLIPSDVEVKENPLFLHPNLLHINMKLNKKNRKLNVSILTPVGVVSNYLTASWTTQILRDFFRQTFCHFCLLLKAWSPPSGELSYLCCLLTLSREPSLKGKDKYSWPPCTD